MIEYLVFANLVFAEAIQIFVTVNWIGLIAREWSECSDLLNVLNCNFNAKQIM